MQIKDKTIQDILPEDEPTPAPPDPPIPEPVIKPMNPEGISYLGWFKADTQNLQMWAGNLFRSDVDLKSSYTQEIRVAAEKALNELQDDVDKISEMLKEYVILEEVKDK